MKHVWILNHYAQLPDGAGGTRHFSLAKNLKAQGWSTSIVAASVEHATGRQRLSGFRLYKKTTISGINWLWLRTPKYKGNGVARIINMLAFTLLVLILNLPSRLQKPNVIIGSSVHPLAAWAGKVLARRYNVPFVLEIRDLWPATLVDMGRLSANGLLTGLLYRLEYKLAIQAALILVLMPRAVTYYGAMGVDTANILALPNGTNTSEKEPFHHPERDKFVLMYCGAMGKANALETLIRSLQLVERNWIKKRGFVCRLIGDGPMRPALEQLSRELKLNSILFEKPVPKDRVPELLQEADAFVITLHDLPRLYRFGVSMNKIFDYMAAGRPTIMAADVPENPIELSKGGIVIPPESPGELAKAILTLGGQPKLQRDLMGRKAWRYVQDKHHYRGLAMKLALALDRVVEKTGHAQK